jgi:hypothetical protein
MLFGETVGRIFEKFYNDEIMRQTQVEQKLLSLVSPTLQSIIVRETLKGGIIDWADPDLMKHGPRSLGELDSEIRETIPRGIRSIKTHRLVGNDAKAEVKLDLLIQEHTLAGRADFIMRRVKPHLDLVILDGKGSRWREKYVERDQLVWYSMLYWSQYNIVPDQIGFLFWRYEPNESMEWDKVTIEEMEDLKARALKAISAIEAAGLEIQKENGVSQVLFKANPSSECKFCSYQPLCPEGSKPRSKGRGYGVEEGDFTFDD